MKDTVEIAYTIYPEPVAPKDWEQPYDLLLSKITEGLETRIEQAQDSKEGRDWYRLRADVEIIYPKVRLSSINRRDENGNIVSFFEAMRRKEQAQRIAGYYNAWQAAWNMARALVLVEPKTHAVVVSFEPETEKTPAKIYIHQKLDGKNLIF